MRELAQKLVEDKNFQLPSEWAKKHEDMIDLINVTGRFNNRGEEDVIDQEAEKLFPYRDLNALQTVGYSEIFGFLEGNYDREEAVRLLKRNSRRYAKRQMTWFKKYDQLIWFHPSDLKGITSLVESKIEQGQ
jgi:tRNA dimethylallyltransferase